MNKENPSELRRLDAYFKRSSSSNVGLHMPTELNINEEDIVFCLKDIGNKNKYLLYQSILLK